MEQILSHFSNALSYIIEKPTDSIIKRRESVLNEFRKFEQMCNACGVHDLWNRLDNKENMCGYTSADVFQIKCKMNELLDDMYDVFSTYERKRLKWILDIFQHASCSKATKSKRIWYYYPPEKKYVYEECAVMMTQILADFDSLLHSEIHSYRMCNTWFFRPFFPIKRLCRKFKIYRLEQKRLLEEEKEKIESVNRKISGFLD